MASAQAPRALPIIPASGERPLQQAFVLRLSEYSLEALRELIKDGLGGEGMELELGGGETVSTLSHYLIVSYWFAPACCVYERTTRRPSRAAPLGRSSPGLVTGLVSTFPGRQAISLGRESQE